MFSNHLPIYAQIAVLDRSCLFDIGIAGPFINSFVDFGFLLGDALKQPVGKDLLSTIPDEFLIKEDDANLSWAHSGRKALYDGNT